MKASYFLPLFLLLFSCHVEKKPNPEDVSEEDVIFEAKEIVPEPIYETYIGVLPCADCPGIRSEIILKHEPEREEGDFLLYETYLDRDTIPHETKGIWKTSIGNEDSKSALLIQAYLDGKKGAINYQKIKPDELIAYGESASMPANPHRYVLHKIKKTPVRMSGYFTYFADAATFKKCKSKKVLLVKPMILYKYMEDIYTHQKKNPQEEMYFTIEGYTEKQETESGQTREFLTVTKVIEAKPGFKCQ